MGGSLMMKSAIIGVLSETSLHPGSGQTSGAIDLPVAREKTTNYPVIPGSSFKGALRDYAEQLSADANFLFGEPDSAGVIAVTDARLLLLPVRSLNTHFVWVTCPYLIERYRRDCELAAISTPLPELPAVELRTGQALAEKQFDTELYLEELVFKVMQTNLSSLVDAFSPLIKHESVRNRLKDSLVVISDDEFNYFASYCLAVNARNVLKKETKTSGNLWYEEAIPADTLFYALLISRPVGGQNEAINTVKELFKKRPYLQVGGNETVGQGWCAVSFISDGGEK
jgi:CRISPR-associated protein Cmr4